MAIDKAAVREGTRWGFRGRIVVVLEVSPRANVIYASLNRDAQAVTLSEFVAGAVQPEALEQQEAASEYRDLLTEITQASCRPIGSLNDGVLICLLRDAVMHLMHRAGEPASAPRFDVDAKPRPHKGKSWLA